MPYNWTTLTEAATAITVTAGAVVAVLGLVQRLATLGEKVGRAITQIWRRWRRERKAKQRRRQNQ